MAHAWKGLWNCVISQSIKIPFRETKARLFREDFASVCFALIVVAYFVL
jgi:hypothetical protein